MKLNIGCGKSVLDGFDGVDSIDNGQRFVCDVRNGLPFADNSIEGVVSSHFVEHLTGLERISFFNELYRVMKVGAPALIITPDYSHASAYGDPTHQWPPMSDWWPLYLNKNWRERFAPHVGFVCDFKHSTTKQIRSLEGFELVSLEVTLTKS